VKIIQVARTIQEIALKFHSLTAYLRRSKNTILLVLVVALITIILSSVISAWLSRLDNLRLPSLGTIYTLGVKAYWNEDLTSGIDHIEWGAVYPGILNNATLYLQSISNIETTLHLDTANWTFLDLDNEVAAEPAGNYMNLTWNYYGATIQPNETIQLTLTLFASSSLDFISYLVDNEVTSFSFDIIISTSEYSS